MRSLEKFCTPITPLVPTGQTVQVFGPPSSYAYGEALNDTTSPGGNSFGCFPSDWPMPSGASGWFGVAAGDGVSFAFGSMCLTGSEAAPTMQGTTLLIWNTTIDRLQAIPVPTTTGVFNPPGRDGSAGGSIDVCIAVTISSVNYLFAVSGTGYQGWQQSVYGQHYALMAFKETAGVWAFDPTHSYTAQQLHNSSAAGASAFPTSTNSFGETVYQEAGPVCMGLCPVSQHLVWGNYFYQTGQTSGSIVACNPATGAVTAFYQYPNVTDIYGNGVSLSPRDLTCNSYGTTANDERFIVNPDMFKSGGGSLPYGAALMEFSYDSLAGTIGPVSTPNVPYTVPGQSYYNTFNLVGYDGSGNLWMPTLGGSGLSVFHGRELHLFMASGNNVPTFENGGPASNWYAGAAGQFPTVVKGDFRLGSFAIAQGYSQSVNWDPVHSNMVLTGIGGFIIGGHLTSPSPALGPELCANGTFTSGTTGWGGFFTSNNLTAVVDSAFTSGHALQMASEAGTSNAALYGNPRVAVTPNQNYQFTGHVKAPTTPRVVSLSIWWYNSAGVEITEFSAPSMTEAAAGVVYSVECLAAAPANAATAFILFTITAGAIGETHLIGDVSWKSVPAITTAEVDTNRGRLTYGSPGTASPSKGGIVGNRLYSAYFSASGGTYPANVGITVPSWLISVDLTAVQ